MSFTEDVFAAVQKDPGGTAEAIRERNGSTFTTAKWERALNRLAKAFRIEAYWSHVYVGQNAAIRIYRKKKKS